MKTDESATETTETDGSVLIGKVVSVLVLIAWAYLMYYCYSNNTLRGGTLIFMLFVYLRGCCVLLIRGKP